MRRFIVLQWPNSDRGVSEVRSGDFNAEQKGKSGLSGGIEVW